MELVKLSDLARISGVGPVFARLLYEAGAETVEVLGSKSAELLFERLHAINQAQQYTKAMASLKDVRYCIEAANALPKIIEV